MPVSRPPTPDKAAIRAELRKARIAADAASRARHAEQVCEALRAALPRLLPAAPTAVTVCAYVPVGAEPGGPALPDVLRSALPTATLLLPLLQDDGDLDWAAYQGELVAAGRGLREPPGPRLGREAITGADLVVVPALAVDRRGVRLGRGGGSYDRALARVRRPVPVVALLQDGELIEGELPAAPHDRPVSAVITPSLGLVEVGARVGEAGH